MLMRVKILNQQKIEIEAEILEGKKFSLPSVREGWRFNFSKHAKTNGAYTYVLVTLETRDEIEGCLIYKMLNNMEPYMAFVEVAPRNRGKDKKYDLVAGCLIAFACRLSFVLGQGDYKGWLAFEVLEQDKKEELKLMALYSSKYKAKRFDKTHVMLICPEDGEALINQYLK